MGNVIQSRLLYVSFLAENGDPEPDWEKVWVDGDVMNSLRNHKHKKTKYMFVNLLMVMKYCHFLRKK